ncbi:hypothetical protein A2291_00365 [candidate division WOR-1 bacterium RIFOXYB2_FULL_42_35]|uniref:Uncharacterized protein n=1 Tax=candidate division WOR-1 bacterium RIFOXYC2_FULL_41_25 TaxID=1802586 RepID=A0A1F4TMR5_UNCSA|nr:MAG: hypothetical protein A2247_01500 [candidate division WOR-1 bacterium RIFOXYA2_FULL_41_14]OGC24254.1 MAG: hypothetical protein A2291_00365 [candidate division WOR-1 bacterium RIFOXYB2_FULL_42_35]OGC33897.1 MAG: hypothetical protein A2462_01335 [candidate division WOR-1 bacterium RIFOXYC2_FULL_41_25]OGC42361.1 MAG: hypothetical protein A2548_05995 [candidate division WOR-1 bacterium RIFOXYD2_FULL_41_8]
MTSIDTALATQIQGLDERQRFIVREGLVFQDLLDYFVAVVFKSEVSELADALKGKPDNMAKLLDVKPSKDLKEITGLQKALLEKIEDNKDLKPVYDKLAIKLTDQTSSADLLTVLNELKSEGLVSDGEKIVAAALRIKDVMDYSLALIYGKKYLVSTETWRAVFGEPKLLADKIFPGVGKLPKLKTRTDIMGVLFRIIKNDPKMKGIQTALTQKLTAKNSSGDLVGLLCAYNLNPPQNTCLSVADTKRQTVSLKTGESKTISFVVQNFPADQAKVEFLDEDKVVHSKTAKTTPNTDLTGSKNVLIDVSHDDPAIIGKTVSVRISTADGYLSALIPDALEVKLAAPEEVAKVATLKPWSITVTTESLKPNGEPQILTVWANDIKDVHALEVVDSDGKTVGQATVPPHARTKWKVFPRITLKPHAKAGPATILLKDIDGNVIGTRTTDPEGFIAPLTSQEQWNHTIRLGFGGSGFINNESPIRPMQLSALAIREDAPTVDFGFGLAPFLNGPRGIGGRHGTSGWPNWAKQVVWQPMLDFSVKHYNAGEDQAEARMTQLNAGLNAFIELPKIPNTSRADLAISYALSWNNQDFATPSRLYFDGHIVENNLSVAANFILFDGTLSVSPFLGYNNVSEFKDVDPPAYENTVSFGTDLELRANDTGQGYLPNVYFQASFELGSRSEKAILTDFEANTRTGNYTESLERYSLSLKLAWERSSGLKLRQLNSDPAIVYQFKNPDLKPELFLKFTSSSNSTWPTLETFSVGGRVRSRWGDLHIYSYTHEKANMYDPVTRETHSFLGYKEPWLKVFTLNPLSVGQLEDLATGHRYTDFRGGIVMKGDFHFEDAAWLFMRAAKGLEKLFAGD